MTDKLFVRPTSEIRDVVDKYANRIYRICLMMLKNKEDAEDVLQEIFIKYMQYEKPFTNEDHRRAWLITVAVNHCKDVLREKKKRNETNFEMCEAKYIKDITDDERLSREMIREALLMLDEKYRSVLYLYYVEGYKVNEIAKMLSKGTSAIKMRLKKGRSLLLTEYERMVGLYGR